MHTLDEIMLTYLAIVLDCCVVVVIVLTHLHWYSLFDCCVFAVVCVCVYCYCGVIHVGLLCCCVVVCIIVFVFFNGT